MYEQFGSSPDQVDLNGALAQLDHGLRFGVLDEQIRSMSVEEIYQEVWGRPIDSEYLAYYTFLLSTDGTLADVRADMEALHLQTVVVPVLSILFVLLQ